MLSPTGAEVLTRKFDEMDQQTTKEEQYISIVLCFLFRNFCNDDFLVHLTSCRKEFYQKFYSVFDDQHAAMDAILNGKEIFSFQVP